MAYDMNINRRHLLGNTLAVTATALLGTSRVFATAENMDAAIKSIVGEVEIGTGSLTLTVPEIAENGNSVPVSVSVDSPMTNDAYVDSVAIFTDRNPNPEVATFRFTPASGEAFATTRMRLVETQNVVAVAKLSDGTFVGDTRYVKVTIGGCSSG